MINTFLNIKLTINAVFSDWATSVCAYKYSVWAVRLPTILPVTKVKNNDYILYNTHSQTHRKSMMYDSNRLTCILRYKKDYCNVFH